jgi:hypothetical protein
MILRWLWHLSYFYVTWGTFFAVAVITFVVLCIHNRTVFSLRRFIRHCVPFEAWTSKSVRMDVFCRSSDHRWQSLLCLAGI